MNLRAGKVVPPLRVVLVDDHAVVRAGLRDLLIRAGFEVVGEAADVEAAVEAVARTTPDVVVIDVRLPGGGAAAALSRFPPGTAALAVSASDERDDIVATMRAGALGYLLKTADETEIVAAVRDTAAGRPAFSPELAGHLLAADVAADSVTGDAAWERLTDREREVLRLLARGRTYRAIADELVLSPKTIETHVRNVLAKLAVTNRHEAARWAFEHHLDA